MARARGENKGGDVITAKYQVKPLEGVSYEKVMNNIRTGLSVGTEQIATGNTCEKWSAAKGENPEKYLARFNRLSEDTLEIQLDDRLIDWSHNPFAQLLSFILGDTFGRAYDVAELRLLDFDLTPELFDHFEACQFGVRGIRELVGVKKRPLFSLLQKPNCGQPPEYYADIARQALEGGATHIKDDELLFSTPICNAVKRSHLTETHIREAGGKALHSLNITSNPELVDAGSSAIMLNVVWVGFDNVMRIVRILRKTDRSRPVHLHRAGHDVLVDGTKSMSLNAFTKCMVLTGSDLLHSGCPFGGIHNPDEVKKNVEIMQSWGRNNPLPIVSRCTPDDIEKVVDFFGTTDLMLLYDHAIYGDNSPGSITRNCRAISDKLKRLYGE